MTGSPTKWADLGPRIGSAMVLAAVGIAAILTGGLAFGLLVALAVGAIAWELTRMFVPQKTALALGMGALGAAAILIAGFIPAWAVGILLVAATLAGVAGLGEGSDRLRYLVYLLYILIAGYGLTALRVEAGLSVVLWLVAIVVATDVAGYFAGRMIGGPKFWPRVSPKKTWAGIVAGWIAAALVGLAFSTTIAGPLVILSVALSFASQMGDAAQSALKRRVGIKDSSNLIPGHGGVFDRFDALLGATFILTFAYLSGLAGG